MWIALSIIGLYVWLFKRRKKTTKQQVPKLMLLLLLFVVAIGSGKAQNEGVTISGKIITTIQDKGKIIVYLVDENVFKIPLTGIDTAILNPSDKLVSFKFKPRRKGIYGIRCFHDLNNNDTLDKRMLFPAEPYGFSWKMGKKYPFGFSDISFLADSNKFITIKMED